MINPLERKSIKKWIFSSSELKTKYKNRSKVITEIIEKAYKSKLILSINEIQFSFFDEKNLIYFFSKKLFSKSNLFFSKFPKIQLTAISLFRRFYLKNSLMRGNPNLILNTSIILATKIEEIDISSKYGKILKEFKFSAKGFF